MVLDDIKYVQVKDSHYGFENEAKILGEPRQTV